MATKKNAKHDKGCMCDACIKKRARALLKDRESAQPAPIPELPVLPLSAEDLPFTALVWFLIVEPRQPKGKIGSIVTPEQSQEVEAIQTTVGRIVHRGALFGEGKTASGMRLNDDPDMAGLKAGDHVLFTRYSGQKVKIRVGDRERTVVVLTDTELMCKVSDPDRIRFWL